MNFQVARGGSSSITEIIEEFSESPAGLTRGLQGFHVRQARGFRVFPQVPFPIDHPSCLYCCSRAVVFPTSLSCLVEGVRSGTRRRPALTSSALVKGCTSAGPGGTAPVPAGAVLCHRYAVCRPLRS